MEITATVIRFDNEFHECLAKAGEEYIKIDPFETGAWLWENREKLIGGWHFYGDWFSNEREHIFVANKITSLIPEPSRRRI